MNKQKFDEALFDVSNKIKKQIKISIETLKIDDQRLLPVLLGSVDAVFHESLGDIKDLVHDCLKDSDHPMTQEEWIPNDILEPIANIIINRKQTPVTVFTIAKNESFFLPIWVSYYSENFGQENLFVLDNDSNDDTIQSVKNRWPNINVLSVTNGRTQDWAWITKVAMLFQRTLLKRSDVVIFSDADEILVSNNEENIGELIERFARSDSVSLRATGYAPVHQIDSEFNVDPNNPLNDREYAYRTHEYDKTLISRVPLTWGKGFHNVYDGTIRQNNTTSDELVLLHMRDIDIDIYSARCVKRSQSIDYDPRLAHGSTNRCDIETYFRTLKRPWASHSKPEYSEKITIPDTWKKNLANLKVHD